MGLIKVWQVRGMGEDFFFHGEKTQGKGKPREKGAEIEKERDNMMQICNISSRTFLRMLNFWLDYEIVQKAYKFY